MRPFSAGPSLALLFLLVCPLTGDSPSQKITVRIDASAAQRLLDKDPRNSLGGQRLLLTPQFELVEPISGARATFRIVQSDDWTAEIEVPAPASAREVQRLALVPHDTAGPDAVRAIAILQDQWASTDPWPLVRGVLAWGWGARDPRYSAKNGTLTLKFPLTP